MGLTLITAPSSSHAQAKGNVGGSNKNQTLSKSTGGSGGNKSKSVLERARDSFSPSGASGGNKKSGSSSSGSRSGSSNRTGPR